MSTTNNNARKTVLITGATRGLGWEFVGIFAARGFDLFLTGRDEDRLQKLKKEHGGATGVTTAVADLSAPDGVAAVLAAVKRSGAAIDILVNNAGIGDRHAFAESDLEKQRAMIQVNVASLVSLTHGLFRGCRSGDSGAFSMWPPPPDFSPVPSCRSTMRARLSSSPSPMPSPPSFAPRESVFPFSVLGPHERSSTRPRARAKSRLVRSGVMEPRRVAEAGVRGLLAGKRMIVPGVSNRLMAASSRFAPRGMAARLAGRFNSDA